MLQNCRAEKKSYSVKRMADFKGAYLKKHFDGTDIEINGRQLIVQFVGVFNVYNLWLFMELLYCWDWTKKSACNLSLLETVAVVSNIRTPKGYTAIIDYAHTPDALSDVLDAIHGVLVIGEDDYRSGFWRKS